jgi:hypothetical protein
MLRVLHSPHRGSIWLPFLAARRPGRRRPMQAGSSASVRISMVDRALNMLI